MTQYTLESLRKFLIESCGCFHHVAIAAPYVSEHDAPDFYRCPEGNFFTVPDPDRTDGRYSQYLFDMIVKENGLIPQVHSIKKSSP